MPAREHPQSSGWRHQGNGAAFMPDAPFELGQTLLNSSGAVPSIRAGPSQCRDFLFPEERSQNWRIIGLGPPRMTSSAPGPAQTNLKNHPMKLQQKAGISGTLPSLQALPRVSATSVLSQKSKKTKVPLKHIKTIQVLQTSRPAHGKRSSLSQPKDEGSSSELFCPNQGCFHPALVHFS